MPRHPLYDNLNLSTKQVLQQSKLEGMSTLRQLRLHREQLIKWQIYQLFQRAPIKEELPRLTHDTFGDPEMLQQDVTQLTEMAKKLEQSIKTVSTFGYNRKHLPDPELVKYLQERQHKPEKIKATLNSLQAIQPQQKAIEAMSISYDVAGFPEALKKQMQSIKPFKPFLLRTEKMFCRTLQLQMKCCIKYQEAWTAPVCSLRILEIRLKKQKQQ